MKIRPELRKEVPSPMFSCGKFVTIQVEFVRVIFGDYDCISLVVSC